MKDPGPVLETERLILRRPLEADLDAWAAFSADREAMRFIGGTQPRALAWRGMATMAGSWALRGFGMFSVIEKATGRWVGRLGPWAPEGWPGSEVGWGLAREAWGKGYATEGSMAAMEFAFETLGWAEVIHTISPGNAASVAVARRLGSATMGPGKLPPPYQNDPVEIWGQSREDWRARRISQPAHPGFRRDERAYMGAQCLSTCTTPTRARSARSSPGTRRG